MKRIRNAVFSAICLAGFLTACGESPTAPPAHVPLSGAAAKKLDSSGWTGSDGSAQKGDSTIAKGPRNKLNSGYILGM